MKSHSLFWGLQNYDRYDDTLSINVVVTCSIELLTQTEPN